MQDYRGLPSGDFISEAPSYGNVPLAKFGHSCCSISKTKVIVFGGASGLVGNYSITNDTLLLNINPDPFSLTWVKLESNSYI